MDLGWLGEGVGGETSEKRQEARSALSDIDAQAMLRHGLCSSQ